MKNIITWLKSKFTAKSFAIPATKERSVFLDFELRKEFAADYLKKLITTRSQEFIGAFGVEEFDKVVLGLKIKLGKVPAPVPEYVSEEKKIFEQATRLQKFQEIREARLEKDFGILDMKNKIELFEGEIEQLKIEIREARIRAEAGDMK